MDRKIPKQASRRLSASDARLFVSVVSIWEILLKRHTGKLRVEEDPGTIVKTIRSQENWRGSFLRFYLSQLVTLAFGIAALFLLVEFMRMNPLIAQLLIISGSVVLSYGLHRYYTFRERLGSSAR